jgi:hypothetical protein
VARGALQADLAVFESRVDDEIGVATNAGGRSTFQNVGRTLRRGAELAARWQLAAGLALALAATWLDATYRDAFKTCAGIPCTAPTVGCRPATGWPARSVPAALPNWPGATPPGASGAGTAGAWPHRGQRRQQRLRGGYGTAALRWSKAYALGSQPAGWRLLVRLDNLFDRVHAGSVIVGDANGRFFEPGAPRNALLALRLVGLGCAAWAGGQPLTCGSAFVARHPPWGAELPPGQRAGQRQHLAAAAGAVARQRGQRAAQAGSAARGAGPAPRAAPASRPGRPGSSPRSPAARSPARSCAPRPRCPAPASPTPRPPRRPRPGGCPRCCEVPCDAVRSRRRARPAGGRSAAACPSPPAG